MSCPRGHGSPVHTILCGIAGDSITTKIGSTLEIQSLLGFHVDCMLTLGLRMWIGTKWQFFLPALPHLHLQPEKVFPDAQRQSPVSSPSAPRTQPRAWPRCWSAALPQRTGPCSLTLFLLFSLSALLFAELLSSSRSGECVCSTMC